MAAIMSISFKEIYQKKVFWLGLILSIGYLVLYGIGVHLIYKDMATTELFYKGMIEAQIMSLGFYFAVFLTAFVVVLTASGSVSAEVENGIMYSVASKPISRNEIILGKFFGIGSIIIVYASFLYLAVLLINLMMGANLAAGLSLSNILKGLIYFDLVPVTLLAVTLLGSSLTNTIGAGIISIILYGLASVGGMLEQFGVMLNNNHLVNVGIISSLIMPSDALYRKMTTSLFEQEGINILSISPFGGSASEPSVWMVAYGIAYIIVVVVITLRVFNQKDL